MASPVSHSEACDEISSGMSFSGTSGDSCASTREELAAVRKPTGLDHPKRMKRPREHECIAPGTYIQEHAYAPRGIKLPPALVWGCLTPRQHYILLSATDSLIQEEPFRCGTRSRAFKTFLHFCTPNDRANALRSKQFWRCLHKGFVKDFKATTKAIVELLKEDQAPTEEKVVLWAVPWWNSYEHAAQTWCSALSEVIKNAKKKWPGTSHRGGALVCRLFDDNTSVEELDATFDAKFDALPHHPDDSNFKLLRKKIIIGLAVQGCRRLRTP